LVINNKSTHKIKSAQRSEAQILVFVKSAIVMPTGCRFLCVPYIQPNVSGLSLRLGTASFKKVPGNDKVASQTAGHWVASACTAMAAAPDSTTKGFKNEVN
jgi:hypothetical protein